MLYPFPTVREAVEPDYIKMCGGKPAVGRTETKLQYREAVEPNYTKMYDGKPAVKTDGVKFRYITLCLPSKKQWSLNILDYTVAKLRLKWTERQAPPFNLDV